MTIEVKRDPKDRNVFIFKVPVFSEVVPDVEIDFESREYKRVQRYYRYCVSRVMKKYPIPDETMKQKLTEEMVHAWEKMENKGWL